MHVRHVVRQFHPVVGGLENTVASLVLSLQEEGVDGSVVTLDRNFQAREVRLDVDSNYRGVAVRRIPFAGSSRYPLAPSILATLEGADIVHVHGIDFFFDFLALTKMIHRKKLVASTHGGFFHTRFARRAKATYFGTITRCSASAYERIIGSSENDAKTFSKIAPRNTVAIENGVDVEKWRACSSPTLTNTLLALGRFSSNKALPDLISLVAALGAPWRLIIAGQESDMRAEELLAIASRKSVPDRVEVHVGESPAGIRALIERSSYLTSASRFEGFGLTAVEGLSAGLLPILNDIAPFRKVVSSAGVGVISNMADPVESAKLVRNFHFENAEQLSRRRQLAINASYSYSWSKVATRFVEEYRRVHP